MKKTESLKELHKKTDVELERLIFDNGKKLVESRIQAKKQETKDTSVIAKMRKEVARAKTLLVQRKFLAEQGAK